MLRQFESFCRSVGLQLEPFQRQIAEEAFSARRELLVSLPRSNGKTTLAAAFALFKLMRDSTAKIYVAAAARDQANVLVDQARDMVRRNDFIRERVKVTRRELRHRDGGVIQAVSADHDKQLGLIPSLIIVDELGAHPDDELYLALRTAMLKVPTSKLIVISHAGWSLDSALGALRSRCLQQENVHRDGVLTSAEGPNIAMLEWSLPESWQLERAAEANPASWIDAADLAAEREAIREAAFRRYYCNQWVSGAEDAAIVPLRWDACKAEGLEAPPPGSKLWVGLDYAEFHDTAAWVALWWRDRDHRQVTACRVFEPPGGGKPRDNRPLRESLLELRKDHRVVLIYDPLKGGEQFVESLKREHGFESPAADYGQSPKQMALAASRLLEAINNRQLRHDGDPVLRQHALNAVALLVGGEGVRFGRPPGPRLPIDALIALAMAHSVASAEEEQQQIVVGFA